MPIGVEAARQGRLLERAGEQISAIGEDRRRAGQTEAPRVILRRHDLPGHLDVGPGREQRSQARTAISTGGKGARFMIVGSFP